MRDLRTLKILKEIRKPTTEVGYDEKLKGKKRESPFEKDDVLRNIIDKALVINTSCDVDDGHVLLTKCDDDGDWLFDSVHSCHICRDKNLFTRVMACEHEKVTLPSGEEVVIETIREVHLKMHNGLVRKLRGVRYIPKMRRNLILLRRLEKSSTP